MYMKEISDIIKDPFIISVVTYVSLLLTIYFGFKIRKKRIYYRSLFRRDGCIIFFWNAGNTTLYKDDILYLYCEVDKPSRVSFSYSTDLDIPLEIEPDLQKNRFSLSFDFLNIREGYYIALNSYNEEPLAKLSGRIRGESRSSVFYITQSFSEISNTIPILGGISLFLILLLFYLKAPSEPVILKFYFLYVVILTIDLVLLCISARSFFMPRPLKKRYIKLKKSGYNISSSENLQ